jgi:Holliday junction resolvasome RuvABC endonuclease subunit
LTTSRIRKVLEDNIKPQTIIAVDASTNSLAFSYFENGKLVKYGKIKFNGTDALYKAGDACKKSIQLFKMVNADALVVESAIYSNSPKTAMQLSIVQGAILGAAQVAGIKSIKTITPMQWQNYVGTKLLSVAEKQEIVRKNPGKSKSWYKGKERETRKQKTIDSVNKNFKVKITDDDVADAIGVGWYVSDKWNVLYNAQV